MPDKGSQETEGTSSSKDSLPSSEADLVSAKQPESSNNDSGSTVPDSDAGVGATQEAESADDSRQGNATPATDETATQFPLALREPTLEYFESLSVSIRQKILETVWRKYSSVLQLMLQSANAAVDSYHAATSSYKKWRIWLISATGTLAIINVIAAFNLEGVFPPSQAKLVVVIKNYLSLTAAVVAALIALFSNVESFLNYADLRSSQRQTRELFLDGFRDFESLWHIYVAPFGYGAQACYNAALLYRRLIDRDRELRRKLASELKQTASTESPPGSGGS